MRGRRWIRLLPSVILMGAVVLVLKTTDLVHSAYAEASDAAASAIGGGPAPSNPDYAGGDDDKIVSASQVDVLSSMARRRKEQDSRQAQLDTQANMLKAAEQRVDAKISQLKQLQAQIGTLLSQRDDAQKAQVASLVKTYSSMKPASAARIFNTLPDEVLVPVAQQMKSDVLATVLAIMDPAAAQKLTVKLADRLTLPQTADASAPAALPAAPADQTASAAPAKPAATPAAAPAAAPAPAKTGG